MPWNPIRGCLECGEGCINCHARKQAANYGRQARLKYNQAYDDLVIEDGSQWSGQVSLMSEQMDDPVRRKRSSRIAVCSMGDLFYEKVTDAWIKTVFEVMKRASRHTYMILTKRPARMAELASSLKWRSNIWAGVTVESATYVGRIDELRRVPAARKFVCLQPMLGPMPELNLHEIDWVVVGGESGAGGRPLELEWVRSVRDQCLEQNVRFWFEQIRGPDDRMQKHPVLDGREWQDMPPLRAGKQAA